MEICTFPRRASFQTKFEPPERGRNARNWNNRGRLGRMILGNHDHTVAVQHQKVGRGVRCTSFDFQEMSTKNRARNSSNHGWSKVWWLLRFLILLLYLCFHPNAAVRLDGTERRPSREQKVMMVPVSFVFVSVQTLLYQYLDPIRGPCLRTHSLCSK